MKGSYSLFLFISLGGLAIIDRRFKLAYFYNKKLTVWIMLFSISIFIMWDVAGILSNIFFIGDNTLLTGIRIGEFPIEELLFLLLLNYNSLIVYRCIKLKVAI